MSSSWLRAVTIASSLLGWVWLELRMCSECMAARVLM